MNQTINNLGERRGVSPSIFRFTNIASDSPILLNTIMKKPKICGIYLVTNIVNGSQYIGQSNNCHRREYDYSVIQNCKYQLRLLRSLKKYGWENHTFVVIHECEIIMLDHWEAYYIYFYNTFQTEHGMNLKDGGRQGRLSKESRDKLGKAIVAHYDNNPEARKRQSESTRKRREAPEEKEKYSALLKKRFEDPKEHEKLSIAQKKRYEDPLQRKRQSENLLKRHEDPAEIERTSQALIAYNANPDVRIKKSIDGKNTWSKKTEEEKKIHNASLTQSVKNMWANMTPEKLAQISNKKSNTMKVVQAKKKEERIAKGIYTKTELKKMAFDALPEEEQNRIKEHGRKCIEGRAKAMIVNKND